MGLDRDPGSSERRPREIVEDTSYRTLLSRAFTVRGLAVMAWRPPTSVRSRSTTKSSTEANEG